MPYEPEVSILTGRISDISSGYIWLESGARIVMLPAMDMRKLSVGMKITVRATRRQSSAAHAHRR